MSDLLPCPFCGQTPWVEYGTDVSYGIRMEHLCRAPRCETEADAAAEWNAANAPADPALLALARFGACIANEYHRGKYGFVSADGGWLDIDAASTGVKEYQGAAEFAPGIADAIARLLAPDGAGEVAP